MQIIDYTKMRPRKRGLGHEAVSICEMCGKIGEYNKTFDKKIERWVHTAEVVVIRGMRSKVILESCVKTQEDE